MPSLLDRDATIDGTTVTLGGFATHADALRALSDARRMVEAAQRLAAEVLTLNPTSGELGEGKARNLIALAERVAS